MSVLSPGGWLAVSLVSVLAMPPAQAPASATFGKGERYSLPAGAVAPKDLYVIANEATIDGTVEGDLAVIARSVRLTGTVKGNTNIVAARIEITGRTAGIVRTVGAAQIMPPGAPLPGAPLPGAPLPAPLPSPAATAPATNPARLSLMSFEAAPEAAPQAASAAASAQAPAGGLTSWWVTSGQLLLGFALLSALLLWRTPGALIRPARAISAHPWRTLLIGLLVAQFSLIVPLATGALVLATAVFWGWFPGVLLTVGLVAGFGLLWFLSPLVTGVWLGRRIGVLLGREADSVPLLVGGVLLLALLGQLPTVGWMVYLVSFVLALGALIESVSVRAAPAPLPAAVAPAPLPAAPTVAPPAPALTSLPAAPATGDPPPAG